MGKQPTTSGALPHDLTALSMLAGLMLASLVISLPIFAPRSFWPAAYVIFCPWLVGICLFRKARWVYIFSYLLGAVFFLYHLRWMHHTTREGYYAAILLYLAFYFPLAALVLRHLNRRRGLPLVLVFPVVWTTMEWLRAHGPLAFPWFLLGHTQIRLPTLIQIADLGGAYMVSFLVAVVNGWVADRAIWFVRQRSEKGISRQHPPTPRHIPVGATVMVVLLAGAFLYGRYRLNTREVTPGPRLAVLQGDFLLSPIGGPSSDEKEALYLKLMDQAAAASPKPDLVVLPETPWTLYLNRELREYRPNHYRFPTLTEIAKSRHQQMRQWVDQHGMNLVIGGFSLDPQPKTSRFPRNSFNSAYFYRTDQEEPGRYDKIHLVPFGEFVPFRDSDRFHRVYRFLNDGPWNPWGAGGNDYSLTHGQAFRTFTLAAPSLNRQPTQFGVTICYEDVMPNVFRQFILGPDGGKRVNFMLNISNDGWFGHGTQQAQHLVSCAFRAIENRVPVARAVNTGISGFVQSDGSWEDIITGSDTDLSAGGEGYRVGHLMLDPRVTVYNRFGDWFAAICVIWGFGGLADVAIHSVSGRRKARARKKG